jgi:hypothetical protein
MAIYLMASIDVSEKNQRGLRARSHYSVQTIIAILVPCLLLLIIVLNYLNVIRLSAISPFFSFLPHKIVRTDTSRTNNSGAKFASMMIPLESCAVTHVGHPLLLDSSVVGNTITGAYVGTAVKLDKTSTQTLSIDLLSDDKKESHHFVVSKNKLLVYSLPLHTNAYVDNLTAGQKLQLNFNCKKNESNSFSIFSVGILSK